MSDMAVTNVRRDGINWSTLITMVIFHVASIVALFMFTWQALAVSLLLAWVAGSLGIGMGFHRLLTHRGYKTPKAIEYFLTVCGLLTLESGAINWVTTHRIHHAHTEGEGDPHSPRDGAWWAHIGWMLTGTAQQYGEDVQRRYAPDLMKDKVHVWLNKYFYLPLVVVGVVLFALGGWPLLMWGIFLRVTVGWHATWLVNSATHMWGTRRFETTDDSTNNAFVAIITWGEGWHNNHHAHPRAARHGVAWYELDVNWMGIRALQLLGLAHDIKLIKATDIVRQDEAPPADALSKAA